jgi:hypothetical protein
MIDLYRLGAQQSGGGLVQAAPHFGAPGPVSLTAISGCAFPRPGGVFPWAGGSPVLGKSTWSELLTNSLRLPHVNDSLTKLALWLCDLPSGRVHVGEANVSLNPLPFDNHNHGGTLLASTLVRAK